MKTKTIIIILLIVLVLSAGIWIWSGKKAASPSVPGTTPGTAPAAGSAASPTRPSLSAKAAAGENVMPLQQGSANILVAILQKSLNIQYKAGLKQDGEFGTKTRTALKSHKFPEVIYWNAFYSITGWPIGTAGSLIKTYTEK
ncbi:MAG: hypothetical protein WCI49_10135 [Ferruginibacter sp.]